MEHKRGLFRRIQSSYSNCPISSWKHNTPEYSVFEVDDWVRSVTRRNRGIGRRRKVCLGGRKALGRRKVSIGARKVDVVVVGLALAGEVGVDAG